LPGGLQRSRSGVSGRGQVVGFSDTVAGGIRAVL